MKTRMESIKVWTDESTINKNKSWLEPLLIKRAMSSKRYGIDLDAITLTGRFIGNMRLGINFAKAFPKWLDLRIDAGTTGGEKTTGFLGLEEDATLLDVIDELPRFASFKMTATDGGGRYTLTLVGIKSYEETPTCLQEVEIRVCDLVYKG